MAITTLSKEDMEQIKQKENKNELGGRIKIENNLVKVIIPNPDKNKNDKVIVFSKREIKELIQDLYMN